MTFARLCRAAIPALLVVLVAVACSGGNQGAATPDRPTATVALERAQAAMENSPQFQFELSHPNGTTTLEGGLQLRKASGTVIAPDDSMSLDAEADLGRIFVRVQAIVIGEQTWMTNPLTGNWSSIAPQDSPFSFLDPVGLVANVLEQTTDASYAESGSADAGQLVINGEVPAEALEPLVGTVIRGATLDATLVIDAETFLLQSAKLSGKLQPNDDETFVRLITFSGFDADLTILPPGVK
ncbi:MAG: LppX_LprAFG lipoprotein [Chloroflexi bacterium]|nr:LppX_LprAFG lipoprotein [Chloroflexota bacterium]